MKKIICILAMVSLAFGMAQADDEQVRIMVIQKTNGQQLKIPTQDIQDVTFEMISLSDQPTSAEEARTMLIGYWKTDYQLQVGFFDGFYLVITEDEIMNVIKVSETNSGGFYDFFDDGEDFADYAGKYVLTDFGGPVIVNPEDPTTATIDAWNASITDIRLNSFVFMNPGMTLNCERVEPFEYAPYYKK